MKRIERLTAILLLLREQPRTSSEIAQLFEVSKRTIFRDIQALCEMGIPIVTQEGAAGGYSLPDGYRLPPLSLTQHETFLLLFSLTTIDQLADTPFSAARVSLRTKLQALLSQPSSDLDSLLSIVQSDVPDRTQRTPFLEAVIEAAQRQQWLTVTYRSAERLSTLHLLPRHVHTQNGYWYCDAYVYEYEEERTFRIDRIQELTSAPTKFQEVPIVTSRLYDDAAHPQVVVQLTPRGVANVESEPHLGQSVERRQDGSGQLVFRCPPQELAWFARYFAGFGCDADVVAPPELRGRLAQLGQQLRERYGE